MRVKPSQKAPSELWMVPEAVDNVAVVKLTGSHGPGHAFPPGETVVNYTAVDGAGNKAFCTFSVFILQGKFSVCIAVPISTIIFSYCSKNCSISATVMNRKCCLVSTECCLFSADA